jgi:hypothetical protein
MIIREALTRGALGALFILTIFALWLEGCVSSKTFKAAQAKINAIPTIHNPPPMASQSTRLTCQALTDCKTYSDVDKVLTAAFTTNGEEQYYFTFQRGFAIATPYEPIDKNGIVLDAPKKSRADQQSVLRNIMTGVSNHLAGLFSAPTEYGRLIVIIVSPDLNKVGSNRLSAEEINGWDSVKYVRIPDAIAGKKLPPNTIVYALLYEFKKELGDTTASQSFGPACVPKIEDNPLILSICNSPKQGKD